MSVVIRTAADFYERHPISAQIILTKLESLRGNIVGLQPKDLWPFDQDHYGGLEANEALAAAAGLQPGQKIVDLCAGLGGPARYYAVRYDVDVTGVDITPSRVTGAEQLTALVGLSNRVRVLQGDVMAIPLANGSRDVVLSQEAFLHVPDLAKTFAEAHRILRPGGMFAFTNWTTTNPLSDPEKKLLWDGMAVQKLYGRAEQERMLWETGFENVSAEDVSDWWRDILVERLAMYQKLRGEAELAATPSGHDAFYASYVLFVELIKSGAIGGARIAARKPG
jgi:ubiquinone/menaquinone biosynthesis C-methylase UbiE